MKKLMIGLVFGLVTHIAIAGEKVDKTLDAKSDGYVTIKHVNGRAKITGWSKDQVRVVGELGDNTKKFIFKRDGNEIKIKVKTKSTNSWNHDSDKGDDLEIFVPYDSQVDYSSTNANVEVTDIRGGADIDTVNGNIEAADLTGRLRIEAVNGEISTTNLIGMVKIETVNGDIKDRGSNTPEASYESVNGDITVQSDSQQVSVETVNGDVDLQLNKVEQLTMDSVNGELDAALDLARNGEVRATSVGGTINLRFTRDISARFDLKSHAGGKIINKLSHDKVQKATYGPGSWLEFSLKGGNGKVDVSTVGGRIKLEYQ